MKKKQNWWISCKTFTCWFRTEGTIIIDAAPILKKFIGQPRSNAIAWAKKCGAPARIRKLKH